jgi:hypothetical protein
VGIDDLMAILTFVLSLILLIAAVASGYQSVDLLPTSLGVLYALAAAVAGCAALVTFAIAVLIRRIDTLTKLVRQSAAPASMEMARPVLAEEIVLAAPATEAGVSGRGDEALAGEDESPININRTGHLPSLEATVETLDPEAHGPPTLVGSYSSAGANYKIFTDGSIEAETGEGTFKFASMSDFKRHLLETKGDREVGA